MQITNSVVCGTSKGCIYKQIKPPLVGEHPFPLMGFVCKEAHVTLYAIREARWPSGRASYSGARGRGFDTHPGRRVVSLSKIRFSP